MAGTDVLLIERSERAREVLVRHIALMGYGCADVPDGVAAARRMRQRPPDVLVIDDDVPLGALRTQQLLRLHADFQQLPAVLLASGPLQQPEGAALDADPALSVLAKPCSGKALHAAIEEVRRRNVPRLSPAQTRQLLGAVVHLPVMNAAHTKILSLLANDDDQVDIPEVVRTVEADPGLTTAVLRVCHAACYGFRGNTLELAMTFLGIERLRSIFQAAIVFKVFPSGMRAASNDLTPLDLWKHSVACGILMEEGGQQVKGRDHFLTGMLHDIGKLIICLRLPDHLTEILRMVTEEQQTMYDAERVVLGVTHAEIGCELACRWGLPFTISTAIAYHHQPSAAVQHRRLSALVHAADLLARKLGVGSGGDLQVHPLDASARSVARYLATVGSDRAALVERVESLVAEHNPSQA